MTELIATIILAISFLGILVILFRKIPVLVELPEITKEAQKERFFLKLKDKIQNISFIKSFSAEIFLQKILSKIRILTLKTENETASWLQKLRERAKRKKTKENDNYWRELKKSTNQKGRKPKLK